MPDEGPEPSEEELEKRLQRLLGEAEAADSEHLDQIELKLRDVESKLDLHTEARKEKEGLFDAEFEERLQALHDRADKAKQRKTVTKGGYGGEIRTDPETARSLGLGLSIAYTIIGAPLAGAFIGWLVDKYAGTTNGKGIGVMVGAAVGLLMAFLMMSRTNKST